MQPEKKKPSPYSLSRKSLSTKEISNVHKALNKNTNEIWLAKVFTMDDIAKYGLEDHL